MCKILASVASFDVIPTEYIYDKILDFDDSQKSSGMRYELVGIETNNFIMNAGTLLWLMIGWLILVAVFYLLNLIGKTSKFS